MTSGGLTSSGHLRHRAGAARDFDAEMEMRLSNEMRTLMCAPPEDEAPETNNADDDESPPPVEEDTDPDAFPGDEDTKPDNPLPPPEA